MSFISGARAWFPVSRCTAGCHRCGIGIGRFFAIWCCAALVWCLSVLQPCALHFGWLTYLALPRFPGASALRIAASCGPWIGGFAFEVKLSVAFAFYLGVKSILIRCSYLNIRRIWIIIGPTRRKMMQMVMVMPIMRRFA